MTYSISKQVKTVIAKKYFHSSSNSKMIITTKLSTTLRQMKAQIPQMPQCGSKIGEKLEKSIELSLGVLIAILNLVEIIMIVKIKRKKKQYEILLLSLSVSDFMFGMSNIFVNIFFLEGACSNEHLLETAFTTYVFFVLTSIFHLSFITVDRLIAVLKPLQHKIVFSRKKVYIFLVLLWILAATISTSLQLLDEFTDTFESDTSKATMQNQEYIMTPFPNLERAGNRTQPTALPRNLSMSMKRSKTYPEDIQFALSIIIVVADTFIVLSYLIIIHFTTLKKKTVSSNWSKTSKLPFICIAIAAIFVFCTLPYAIGRFAYGKAPFWANVILILNSGMNSIVYFFRTKISRYWENKMKTYISSTSNPKISTISLPTSISGQSF